MAVLLRLYEAPGKAITKFISDTHSRTAEACDDVKLCCVAVRKFYASRNDNPVGPDFTSQL
jgi:hypothetical protein